MIYEVLKSQIQQCTDIDDPFYSEYFGRVDLGYSVDGPGSGLFVTDGLLLRNAVDSDGNETKLSLNFLDIFYAKEGLRIKTNLENQYYNNIRSRIVH